jgi:hypothetical protein
VTVRAAVAAVRCGVAPRQSTFQIAKL